MKLPDKISWLLGCVQRSLFPDLNQCFKIPLTQQEEKLVSMLEILQIEQYVPTSRARYRWSGRKPIDRNHGPVVRGKSALPPTTSDLIRALQSAKNLRRTCGFVASGDISSESTFLRAFAAGGLSNRVHEALVDEYLAEELVGHISRDSTAITGREKPRKRWPKSPARKGVPPSPPDCRGSYP